MRQRAEEGRRRPVSDSASPALQSPGFTMCSMVLSRGESSSYALWKVLCIFLLCGMSCPVSFRPFMVIVMPGTNNELDKILSRTP